MGNKQTLGAQGHSNKPKLEFPLRNCWEKPRSVLLSIQIADAHNIIMVTFFEKSGSIIRSYNHNKILVENHKKLAMLPPKYVHEKCSQRLFDFGLLLKKVEFTNRIIDSRYYQKSK